MNILLTGAPGCGKSTAISKIIDIISRQGKTSATGFYTREIRSGSQREGFEIVTLAGKQGLLAHVNHPKKYSVGKYGVDVDTFEKIAIEELSKPTKICIIDEIGKMETLYSKTFNSLVRKILEDKNIIVIGTIALRGGGFIAEVQQRKDVKIIELTPANRDSLPENILKDILTTL